MRNQARQLGERLQGLAFAQVFTSPLQRAARTCELAGCGAVAKVNDDLAEWNYGAYEGQTTEQIWQQRPGWDIFRDGCPDGESAADVAVRARRVIDRVRTVHGNTALVLSGLAFPVMDGKKITGLVFHRDVVKALAQGEGGHRVAEIARLDCLLVDDDEPDLIRCERKLFMSLTVDLTSEEAAQIKQITRMQDGAAAVTKAARAYLRLSRLRELKAVSGKADYDDKSAHLEPLELDEIGFPK